MFCHLLKKESLGHQAFLCKSNHVLKSSSHQKYTEDNHNGRHDGTKYGNNSDELNPTYHCCSGNN